MPWKRATEPIPAGIAALAQAHGLTIRSINALQRFDQFDMARENEASDLLRYAAACGAQAIVLCPTNSRQDRRTAKHSATTTWCTPCPACCPCCKRTAWAA